MADQLAHFFSTLSGIITQPKKLLILFLASFMGILFGAMPGLTATLGVALLATLTYGMQTETALIAILGLYVGAIYGGSYPAILINIPGTPAAAATALDGYPLASRGEGGRALGLTTTASFIGTLIGLFFLIFLAPMIARLAFHFTQWEYFLLALFGIVISGTLASDDLVIKGWIAGFIGLFLACIGRDKLQAFPRYTFGQSQLESGLEIVPILIGVFGVPQIIRVLAYGQPLAKKAKFDRVLPSLHSMLKNMKHIIRSACIGVGIGAVPGIGEDIAGWVSYSTAKNTSTETEKAAFGQGSETGLISSETANNACVGGALIPLLTLGIPGSPPAAMLLGALLLHGITPGPEIETARPGFLVEVTAILVLASIAMWVNGLLLAKQVVKLLYVPAPLFMPVIALLCMVGAYTLGLNLFNLYLMVPVGVAAFLLGEMKYPISPLVIGLVLGGMADESLRRALLISEGSFLPLFQRPLAMILLITILYFVLSQLFPIKTYAIALVKRVKRK